MLLVWEPHLEALKQGLRCSEALGWTGEGLVGTEWVRRLLQGSRFSRRERGHRGKRMGKTGTRTSVVWGKENKIIQMDLISISESPDQGPVCPTR